MHHPTPHPTPDPALPTRRDALRLGLLAAAGAATLAAAPRALRAADPAVPSKTSPPASPASSPLTYPFTLAPLPYDAAALEPHIDAATIRLHHDKHHQVFVDNLNKALADCPPTLQKLSIEELLKRLPEVPEKHRTTIRNSGGGHANHQLFWKIMAPAGSRGTAPKGDLLAAINRDFGSVDALKTAFNEAGAKVFGSGWVFLVTDPKNANKLKVHTTANQDSVLFEGLPALFGNDVWEHAYYLKHQNRRADYLKAWWNVLAWDVVADRHAAILAGNEKSLGGPTA